MQPGTRSQRTFLSCLHAGKRKEPSSVACQISWYQKYLNNKNIYLCCLLLLCCYQGYTDHELEGGVFVDWLFVAFFLLLTPLSPFSISLEPSILCILLVSKGYFMKIWHLAEFYVYITQDGFNYIEYNMVLLSVTFFLSLRLNWRTISPIDSYKYSLPFWSFYAKRYGIINYISNYVNSIVTS